MSWPEEMWSHFDTGRRSDLSRVLFVALALVGLALAIWGSR